MQPQQIEMLENIGVDLNVTLERFVGNENLYFRCIGKLLNSNDFSNMINAIEAKDAAGAFEHSHSLKGVVSNLGFDNMFKAIQPLVEVFRAGSMDYPPEMLDDVKKEYELVILTINKVLGNQ